MKTAILLLAAISILTGACVIREVGNSPGEEEIKGYEKLSYFKDGVFESRIPLQHFRDKVRNGPSGWARFLTASRFAPENSLPKVRLDRSSFPEKQEDFTVYWLGHSAAIMDIDGKRIIFDPVLENAAPIPFAVPRYDDAPIERDDLPAVDYVVITHNHYDHLERKTVQSIRDGHFIVPLGIKTALVGWGVAEERITELGWGDTYADGISFTAVEGVHYSNRGLGGRNKTLWNSYVILTKDKKIFWSGDTGYGPQFKEAGDKYGGFDFAALEIDGWNPGWPNTHLFPEEVAKAAADLRAENLLPIHWAVFDLALHPWHESIDMVLEQMKDAKVNIITPKMGEKATISEPTTKWWLK